MASLYADENFNYRIVVELRNLGHDVLTAHAAGQANQSVPDQQVLAFAVRLRRAVLTHNRVDYIKLHKQGNAHCGIIACTDDPKAAAVAGRIHQAILSTGNLTNQLLRVNKPALP